MELANALTANVDQTAQQLVHAVQTINRLLALLANVQTANVGLLAQWDNAVLPVNAAWEVIWLWAWVWV
jgi:hypothetical protein